MLAEWTGVLQIGTCLMICVATAIWLRCLNLSNKMMWETRRELQKAELKIWSLEAKVEKLTRLAWVNNEIEMVRDSINTTKEQQNDTSS